MRRGKSATNNYPMSCVTVYDSPLLLDIVVYGSKCIIGQHRSANASHKSRDTIFHSHDYEEAEPQSCEQERSACRSKQTEVA